MAVKEGAFTQNLPLEVKFQTAVLWLFHKFRVSK